MPHGLVLPTPCRMTKFSAACPPTGTNDDLICSFLFNRPTDHLGRKCSQINKNIRSARDSPHKQFFGVALASVIYVTPGM